MDSRPTTQRFWVLMFLYGKVLQVGWAWLSTTGGPTVQTRMPGVLAHTEVAAVLAALEGEHRSFEKVFGLFAADVAALRSLLTIDNLNELSRWGAHRDAATPFWIRATTDAVHAAKGPHTSAAGRRLAGGPLR